MTGSHSRLGISDRESRTTGVIHAYDNVMLEGGLGTRYLSLCTKLKSCKSLAKGNYLALYSLSGLPLSRVFSRNIV